MKTTVFSKKDRQFFFFSAPPLKGSRPSKKKLPNPPFKDAKPWQRSVFYYWWEYLRRHEGYRKCCENGGKGQYSKLYRDFGDIHAVEFWTWWKERGQYLFSEPVPLYVDRISVEDAGKLSENQILVSVPLTQSMAVTTRQLKRLLLPLLKKQRIEKKKSRAMYPVASKPILSALHQHLRIYDLHKANPKLPYHKIADLAGIIVETGYTKSPSDDSSADLKHLKTMAIGRHINIAKAYIENVALGKFPYRTKKSQAEST
jgi:hypothetical protein